MKTLPHWANLLPLLGASLAYYLGLGWLRLDRRAANLAECGQPPRTYLYHQRTAIERPEPPSDEWCPAHECWYTTGDECPDCREEWGQTWTLGEEPAASDNRDDSRAEAEDAEKFAKADEFWAEFDALAIADREREDGWYLDLCYRAENPHNGWRVD